MVETKEQVEVKIKANLKERNDLVIRMEVLQKELVDLEDTYLSLLDNYIKIECFNPQCRGKGYVKDEGDRMKVCPICLGKGYKWLKKYEGTKETKLPIKQDSN